MNFIIITFALKLAFVPCHIDLLYSNDYRVDKSYTENYYYIEGFIQADLFNIFFIRGIVNIPLLKANDDIDFFPINLGSVFSAGIYYNIFELGYTHYCIHPVIPSYYMNHAIKYEGFHGEFYLQIKGKI